MMKKEYMIVFKILIYVSLGLFILFKGEEYFHLPSGVRKILIFMLFLFAFLRIFEGVQLLQNKKEKGQMRL